MKISSLDILVGAPFGRALLLVIFSSLVFSCAQLEGTWGLSREWVGPDLAGVGNNSLAAVSWSKDPGVIVAIDGNSLGKGYARAKLRPGRHVIEYADYPAEFGVHPKGSIELELRAGHVYEFHIKPCYWCMPRKYAVWVDDKTTGDVVWGKLPDWPSWWL